MPLTQNPAIKSYYQSVDWVYPPLVSKRTVMEGRRVPGKISKKGFVVMKKLSSKQRRMIKKQIKRVENLR